jgi:hypothetical protein
MQISASRIIPRQRAGAARACSPMSENVDKAMAQAFDIDACMKVVLTLSGG